MDAKNKALKLFEKLYQSCYYFLIFNQQLYLKCILLQISLFEYYKVIDSPIWSYFLESPQSFYEVKGEWSLSTVSKIIQSKNIHMDIKLSSKYYILTKFANQQSGEYNFSNQFFGYKNKRKIYNQSSIEVQQLIPIIY